MHEFSMTSQIIREVLKETEAREAKKVLEVHLVIGDLTLLGIEQIKSCYMMLVDGTVMEGSMLKIKRKKGKVICEKCRYKGPIQFLDDPVYHVSFPTLMCPRCGSPARIIEGKECLIKRIKMMV